MVSSRLLGGVCALLLFGCTSPLSDHPEQTYDTEFDAAGRDARSSPTDAGTPDAYVPQCLDLIPTDSEVVNSVVLDFVSEQAPVPSGSYPSVALVTTDDTLYYHDFRSAHLHRRDSASTWTDLGLVSVGQIPTLETNTLGNGSAVFIAELGDEGSILVVHEAATPETQIARYDIKTQTWTLTDGVRAISHGMNAIGNAVYGLQHAGGQPFRRFQVNGDPLETGTSMSQALLGVNAGWISRAASLTANGSMLYGIKNDWQTSPRGDGDRLFRFESGGYVAGGVTDVEDLGELPFEIGDGALAIFLPAGWQGVVSTGGALFVTEGRGSSDHEGFGISASNRFAIYDIACDVWNQGELPAPSGSGTSVVMMGSELYIKRGGDPETVDDTLWVVR